MNDSIWLWLVSGFALATSAYVVSRRLRIYAVMDLVWSFGIFLGTWVLALGVVGESVKPRVWCVVVIATLWSSRLSWHLIKDRLLQRHEDPRYQNLVNRWGKQAPRNFYCMFLLQLLLVALFLVPIGVAMNNPSPFGWLDVLAVLVAVTALIGEGIADSQLAKFRAHLSNSESPSQEGRVCDTGLWRFSRHPNYFFEWLLWWSYVLHAFGSSDVWYSLLGPAIMYIFLRYITGIPPSEYSSLKRRGAAYARYQATTSPFFLWKPKKIAESSD